MLIRFSVGNKAGIEIFSYEPDSNRSIFTNPQLVSGFLQAIQSFSEVIGSPLKGIQFFNMILYFKAYGDFSLRLLVSTPLEENLLEEYFSQLAKQTLESVNSSSLAGGEPVTSETYYSAIVSILSSLTGKKEAIQPLPDKIPSQSTSYVKIALVGLARVGKTSIKRSFFEKKSHVGILPTIQIERNSYFQHILNQSIDIIDLGGQEPYIEQYIHDETIWYNVSLIIFVVDLSDPENFEKAHYYLQNVWKIVKDVNKSRVALSIFFHKYDPETRNELDNNIQAGLLAFKDFINVASFYLTTVKDNSSHVSLVKSMYFSLPNLIIKHLLEESFIDSFEDRLLKSIPILPESALTEELFSKLYKKGKNLGFMLTLEFQESWLKVVTNEWIPKPRSSTRIELFQDNTRIKIKVNNWTNLGISYLCTNQVLSGIIEGLLSSFYLSKPKIIETNENYTIWLIEI